MTLLVNLSGSLAIGFLVPLTEHVAAPAPLLRPLLIVGFLGGWTTYSTLAVDATLLAKNGDVVTCLRLSGRHRRRRARCSWSSAMRSAVDSGAPT